jgi:hypothetical protein
MSFYFVCIYVFENGSAFAYKNEVTVTLALNIKVNRDLEDIYLKGGPDNILGVKKCKNAQN